jgi:protein-S-isoprenylcysteine O-methyltransferase Ste14
VGVSGQLLSALLCLLLGLMLLLLVHFNGLWFLWPLSILAVGVILFGVLIAHSAMTNARESFAARHPARRFRAAQEIAFWSIVFGGGYGIYLILTTI